MYKVMSQIPSGRIKGKITELVDFDTNDGGGVYYGGTQKKIYTHAGRLDAGREKGFDKEGEVLPKGEEVEEDCKPAPGSPPMKVSNHTLLHEAAHAEDDGVKFMEGKWGVAEFGGWQKETPASIAKVAAPHLKFDEDWIRKTLEDKGCKPPEKTPKPPKGVGADVWEKRRQEALTWCETIRAANGIWWKGAICQRIAIGGRVYQESYDDGRWRSYLYAARAKGISGYQFRAPAEWFAELYAAYFGEKLKPSHPAMSWLVKFKPRKSRRRRASCRSSAAPTSTVRRAAPRSRSSSCTASTPTACPSCAGEIVDESFQVIACPKCGNAFRIEPDFNYVEHERNLWIAALPLERLPRWREEEAEAEALFERVYGPRASAFMQADRPAHRSTLDLRLGGGARKAADRRRRPRRRDGRAGEGRGACAPRRRRRSAWAPSCAWSAPTTRSSISPGWHRSTNRSPRPCTPAASSTTRSLPTKAAIGRGCASSSPPACSSTSIACWSKPSPRPEAEPDDGRDHQQRARHLRRRDRLARRGRRSGARPIYPSARGGDRPEGAALERRTLMNVDLVEIDARARDGDGSGAGLVLLCAWGTVAAQPGP